MEDEAIVNEILAALERLLQVAGPEWVLEFLNAGLEMAAGEAEAMPAGEPPPRPANALAGM